MAETDKLTAFLKANQLEFVSGEPAELRGRFNNFIVTEFDDSLSIEMQMRSMLKWLKENIRVTNAAVGHMDTYKNLLTEIITVFMDSYDTKLSQTLAATLTAWQNSGKLDQVVNDALQWEFDTYKAANESDKSQMKTQIANKVGNGVKAEPEDLSERTLSLVTGGTVNLQSVPQDKSVTAEKLATDIATEITANNLQPADFMPQGYINSYGEYIMDAQHKSSNLIPVEELEWLWRDTGSGQWSVYDRDGNFMQGFDDWAPGPVRVPQNIFIKYARFVVKMDHPNPVVVRGKYPKSYEFTEKVLPLPKPTEIMEPSDLKYIEKIPETNLIDYDKLTVMGYYDAYTGDFVESWQNCSSHIIPCKAGDTIFRDRLESGQVSFWDAGNNFRGGHDSGSPFVKVPDDPSITGFRVNFTIGENVRLQTGWVSLSETAKRTRYKLGKNDFEIEAVEELNTRLNQTTGGGFIRPYHAVTNPIITKEIVTDRTGVTGVADPFIVVEDGNFHCFFEVLSTVTGDEIGHAWSPNLKDWTYTGIVLSSGEHGHRSAYPNVFKVDGVWYMLPDTGWQVNLYKATSFPDKWERIVDYMLPNDGWYNDTNVFEMNGKWYLTTSSGGEGVRLYRNRGDDFKNDQWDFISVIIPSDAYETNMRCGGNPIMYDDYALLPIQVTPADGVYGQYLYWYKLAGFKTGSITVGNMGKLLDRTLDNSWSEGAMHHASGTPFRGKHIFAVDGWRFNGEYSIGLYTDN